MAKLRNPEELDLFGHIQTDTKKTKKKVGFNLSSVKKSITISYENAIFLTIGFVMSCAISFSLGVEKGRHDNNYMKPKKQLSELNKLPPISAEYIPSKYISQGSVEKTQNTYAIQLASFSRKESSEEELARLKREGYNALIKKSGDYHQLYIGNFEKKETAQALLKKLKVRYKDCYIKRE